MRRTPLVVLAALLLTLTAAPPAVASTARAPEGLRTEHQDRPLGIDATRPGLSWRNSAAVQKAYQIQAATTPGRLVGRPDLWDSGRVTSTDVSARYDGKPLASRERVYWRVRTWSALGPSAWSAPSWFELGLTTSSDWSAGWVTNPQWQLSAKQPAPVTVELGQTRARYVRLDVSRLGLPLAEQPIDAQNRLVTSGDARRFPLRTYRLQLAELRVLDPSGANLAADRGKYVTASETETIRKEWEPALVADGLTTSNPTDAGAAGYQSAAHAGPDASIQLTIDLGAVHDVARVQLFPRTDTLTDDGRTANFPVDYSVATATDGDYATAATVTGQQPPATWLPSALPLFARDFSLAQQVTSARLYVSGLGVYVPTLNGTRVGDAVLEPGDTDYTDRVTYAAYDVTSQLRRGANTLGLAVGNGTANALHTSGRYRKFARSVSDPQVIAQLEVTLANGRTQRIVTDPSWRTTLGPTTSSNWYGGEDYDARREATGPTSTWAGVVPATTAPPVLSGRLSEPVRIVERLAGTEVSPGVFDVGRVIAGVEQLTVTAPAGTVIRAYPSESLRDGHVDQSKSNVGTPIWDSFTSRGGTRTWHPEFGYHSFRYVEIIAAAPATVGVTGLRTMADNDAAGTFDTSNDILDGIHRLTAHAVENNMMSLLTDCPSREKLGWLEQDQLAFDAIARSYDVRAYLDKIVRDMADGQEASGLVPSTVPDHVTLAGSYRDDPNWGGAIVLVPLQAWRTYGDTELLTRYYPRMQQYLSYLTGQSSRWVDGVYDYGLGDWITTESPQMPKAIPASFGVWRIADGLAQIAAALGEDPAPYRQQADALAAAVWAKYYAPATGLFGGGGQGATALALDMGAVPESLHAAQLDHLVQDIAAEDNHLIMGEISFPSVLRVLTDNGREDIVYAVATQTSSPSLGHQVVAGLTALGETWDGGSGQSQSHFMLGALDSWLQTRLTGIGQAAGSVGFARLDIDPAIVGDLRSASGSYRTPRGTVATSWQRTGTGYTLRVTVPPGSLADVHLPAGVRTVGPGTWSFHA